MSSRVERLRALVERGATPGERAAAARALEIHEAKLTRPPTAAPRPAVEPPKPPGPELLLRGGPFTARGFDGLVWVAIRGAWADLNDARQWVEDRRQMMVRLVGKRRRMIPTAVEVDDERQQVFVTADADSLSDW